MASVNRQRVRTRSQRKTTYPDISETTEDESLTQSTEITSSVLNESDSEDLSKMESDGVSRVRRRSPRKRMRRTNGSEGQNEEKRTETKKTRAAAVKNTKTKDQAPTMKRELRVTLKKIVYSKKEANSSGEADDVSEKESGVASSYSLSSSSSSSLSDGDSDSPVPTSELSDSSPDIDSSTYESSGNEDISWRIRKSPRKRAQINTRKKIAEIQARHSDSEDSTSSLSESSNYDSDD